MSERLWREEQRREAARVMGALPSGARRRPQVSNGQRLHDLDPEPQEDTDDRGNQHDQTQDFEPGEAVPHVVTPWQHLDLRAAPVKPGAPY